MTIVTFALAMLCEAGIVLAASVFVCVCQCVCVSSVKTVVNVQSLYCSRLKSIKVNTFEVILSESATDPNAGNVQEEEDLRGGYQKPMRRGAPAERRPAPIGKKMSTTNAHEDYSLRPVSCNARL